MVDLTVLRMTKADLERIPRDERLFYLMASHFSNELNILGQLLLAAKNTSFLPNGGRIPGPKADASTTQFILFTKLLAGRLHEVNKVVNSLYYGKGLNKKYTDQLSENGKDALRAFRSILGKKPNLISDIRNKFAFHSPTGLIEETYKLAPDDYALEQYLGAYWAHNLFYGIEKLTLAAMAELTGAQTLQDAVERILGDVVMATRSFNLFAGSYIQVIMRLYLKFRRAQVENITIADEPSISHVVLPYFAAAPEPPG